MAISQKEARPFSGAAIENFNQKAVFAVMAAMAANMAVTLLRLYAPQLAGTEKVLVDFDAFHVVGEMARRGQALDAYYALRLMEAYREIAGSVSFMPWTYPPPYTLLVQGLAWLPLGIAYLLFISLSMGFYLLALRRIAGENLAKLLILLFPMFTVIVRCGQNGFLTGGLVGFFLIAFLRRRAEAGIPLGLMIVKPHLALGISLLALLGRRWSAMAVAAGTVAAALGISTLAFGPEIWESFRHGLRESGEFLRAGIYPLHRMTSVYAFLRSFEAPASLAFAAHGLGALIAVGIFLRVWFGESRMEVKAAAACFASIFVSPYNYDYDLAIFGLGLALLLPDLLPRVRPRELIGFGALCWLVTSYGMVMSAWGEATTPEGVLDMSGEISLAAPALILLVVWLWAILRRPLAPERSAA